LQPHLGLGEGKSCSQCVWLSPSWRVKPWVGTWSAPIASSTFVHKALLPGGTIFEDTHSVTGAPTTPKQSADDL
jgi:hypothetical protein